MLFEYKIMFCDFWQLFTFEFLVPSENRLKISSLYLSISSSDVLSEYNNQ